MVEVATSLLLARGVGVGMQVTVVGAAEPLGRAVVSEAVSAEHGVTAVVPDTHGERVTAELGADTVVADAVRGRGFADVLREVDAVVFVPSRAWSGEALGVAAVRVTDAMARAGVRRFVTITGAGARDRRGDRTVPLRAYDAVRGLRGRSVRSERAFAGRVADSAVDWTVVRAARLTDGEGDGVFQHGYRRVGLRDAVSRANAATFLVTVAGSASYVGGMPVVTEKMKPRAQSSGPLAAGAPAGR